ncbi:hypothetical protein BofuT4_uP156630.1 [Botrytis cinerea T4]|uniref:Uncharacterized protein n=1 Tax=Botryotinia fuckeliana (strain T4) TaxID=999810 RepID=G2YUG9_BOTF4|nr:hypothetical protein BofuT4_uP156630.1 [Botrytis cinerea T4]
MLIARPSKSADLPIILDPSLSNKPGQARTNKQLTMPCNFISRLEIAQTLFWVHHAFPLPASRQPVRKSAHGQSLKEAQVNQATSLDIQRYN